MADDFLIKQKIRWIDRILNAVTQSIASFLYGIAAIFAAPIIFFRTLFTSERVLIDINQLMTSMNMEYNKNKPTQLKPPTVLGPDHFINQEEREDWKVQHDEEYGK